MSKIELRDYEVSLWTIQDSFITVLKSFGVNHKGQLQEPEMTIKDDGTLEFSFSIPMYIREDGKKKENPLWFNTRNGNVLVDLRKLKVIFNKKVPKKEKVFEFLITKVTEKHEKGSLICEVTAEGLAFHELGKIGYKIALTKDTFYNDFETDNQIKATLNYWCEKIFGTENHKKTRWDYEICMDWTAQDGSIQTIVNNDSFENYYELSDEDKKIVNAKREELGKRRHDKIYENEYISSWGVSNNQLVATGVEPYKEKERLVEITESNIYNITQTLAETFGVFCKYEYIHDELYYIIGRRVIFYNNFIQESTGSFTLSYPYQTSHIEREMDATDLVTKLYVKPVTDDTIGDISIINTPVNKNGEDYILNFDYLHEIGVIDDDKYDAISIFEAKVKKINLELEPILSDFNISQIEQNDWKAKMTIAENAITAAEEVLQENKNKMYSINNGEETLSRGDTTPFISILLKEDNADSGYLRLSDLGIQLPIKIYSTLSNSTVSGDSVTINDINSSQLIKDDNNNIVGIRGLAYPSEGSKTRYLTYSYKPLNYYENIIGKCLEKIQLLEQQKREAETNYNNLETIITNLTDEATAKQNEKQQLIEDFEKLMGPALREGTWQPEDYSDYGEYIEKSFVIDNLYHNYSDGDVSFIWDTEPFDGEEQVLIQNTGENIGGETVYNLCLNLDGLIPKGVYQNRKVIDRVLENLENLAFCYYKTLDGHYDVENFTPLRLHSGCEIAYIIRKNNPNLVIPVLVLKDNILQDFLISNYKINNACHPSVSSLNVNYNNSYGQMYEVKSIIYWDEDNETDFSNRWIYTRGGDYIQVYPRIKVSTPKIINSSDQINLIINDEKLIRFEDYAPLTRNDISYFTISSEKALNFYSSFSHGKNINFSYKKSHTDVSIYLDALEVSKENAYPKVSYTVDIALTNKSFIEVAYNTLNKIVKIVDTDLKFYDVQGYISELQLNLDRPGEDKITVQNYKTKFEDLFSTIVAQTEEMKKISPTLTAATAIFSTAGEIKNNLKFSNSGNNIIAPNGLSFKNANGIEIMRLDSLGNLYIKGSLQIL